MSNQRYTPEFKDEAVRQILEKGHFVTDVAERLGVSSLSLYKWVNAVKPSESVAQANELLDAKQEVFKLRAQLRRAQEERDILKKAAAMHGAGTSRKTPSEVPVRARASTTLEHPDDVSNAPGFTQRILSMVTQTDVGSGHRG